MNPHVPWSGRLAPLAGVVLLALLPGPGAARADGDVEARRSPVVRAVEQARAGVVSIHATRLVPRNWYGWELPSVEGTGVGSGVIFHPDGYVITNAHVIQRASQVLVDLNLADGSTETHEARVFAVDIPHDLAIVRMLPRSEEDEGRQYPSLPLGRSGDLMVGETVIALGTPFGIGLTVTTGVIGGLHRNLRGPAALEPGGTARGQIRPTEQVLDDFIQIDAAINPGNSGGPLLDITGRWIGVNTAIWNRQQSAAEGIGFAVPVDQVRALVGRAFERRRIRGDWPGVELVAGAGGAAEVRFVFPKGPAVASGIEEKDRIVSVDGEATATLFDVRWRMATLPLGASVRLGIERRGRPLPAPVTLRLAPVLTPQLSDRHLGLVAVDVGEDENRPQELRYDAGVLVQAVRPDGPAAQMGLRPGDLVVGLGTYRIRDTDDLLVFLQYVQPGDLVQVRVVRIVRLRSGQLLTDEKDGSLQAE